MPEPIAFFCRAKPQEADAFEIFDSAKRVFVGYPLYRSGVGYDPARLQSCLVSPDPRHCADEEWLREIAGSDYKRQCNRNRNFIPSVVAGSIVVIPRPERGAMFAARVTGDFEIVDAPSWAADYMSLRARQGRYLDDEKHAHIADVAQGWKVDGYVRIDLGRVPGWIRHSTLQRQTYGVLKNNPFEPAVTAWSILDKLLRGDGVLSTDWTSHLDRVKSRLVAMTTPSSFEHLIVSLLQLEYPDQIWQQTGGPGDGGIDGIGSTPDGKTIGIMQAKWSAYEAPDFSKYNVDPSIQRFGAVLLLGSDRRPTDGTQVLDIDWIAKAVIRHSHQLPFARALRVNSSCNS